MAQSYNCNPYRGMTLRTMPTFSSYAVAFSLLSRCFLAVFCFFCFCTLVFVFVLQVPIFSLPQEWLWCESWCSDSSKKQAKTIDLCNNPQVPHMHITRYPPKKKTDSSSYAHAFRTLLLPCFCFFLRLVLVLWC